MSEWQPIATAPKNVPVLVWPSNRGTAEGHFAGNDHLPVIAEFVVTKYDPDGTWRSDLTEFERGWESTGSYTIAIPLAPTHWAPLLEPPEAEQ